MARRGRRNRTVDTSLLGKDIRKAVEHIAVLCDRVVAVSVQHDLTREGVVRALFNPDTIRVATEAKGIINPLNSQHGYSIVSGTNIYISYNELPFLAINPANLEAQPGCEQVVAVVEKIKSIHARFSTVRYVLEWFNTHATAGAVRHYWPTILSLVDNDAVNNATLGRYKEPDGISSLLPLIRETATTVASALILPATEQRHPGHMWVSFSSAFIFPVHDHRISYTDQQFTLAE